MTAEATTPPFFVSVSLKMYFGHDRTRRWAAEVAAIARRHPAVTSGLVELAVLPTFPSLLPTRDILGPVVSLGAQDLAAADSGAFTGEVSGAELAEIGCTFAEVGHAERRRIFGESDEVVAAKVAAALRHGLVPLICVGEIERAAPTESAELVIAELHRVLHPARAAGLRGRIVVAYEPHWAIGAAEPAPIDHIATVAAALGTALAADEDFTDHHVIYGGSAGPGLLSALDGAIHGLFLGRSAHEPAGLEAVLDEISTMKGLAA